MKRIGIYSGMFDPLHNGHLWVVDQAVGLFDEVHVVIGPNPVKEPWFDENDRLQMLDSTLNQVVKRLILPDYNIIDYAKRQEGQVTIIRGMRNQTDYLYEEGILNCMRSRAPGLRYIYLIPPMNLRQISSTLIKNLCWRKMFQVVRTIVPDAVFQRLVDRCEINKPDDAGQKRGIHIQSSSGHTFEITDREYKPETSLESQRAYFDKAVKAGMFTMRNIIRSDQVEQMIDEVPFDVIMSDVFYLKEIDIDRVVPTGDRYVSCSKSLGPIIVDQTNPELPERFQKGPVLIIEGKHRWLDAKERGETTILAWVGEKAMKYFESVRLGISSRGVG